LPRPARSWTRTTIKVTGLVKQLGEFQKQAGHQAEARTQLQQMEAEARAHPTNIETF